MTDESLVMQMVMEVTEQVEMKMKEVLSGYSLCHVYFEMSCFEQGDQQMLL